MAPSKMISFYESHFEAAALQLLAQAGWATYGPHLAPGEPAAERAEFSEAKFSDYA